MKKIFIIAGTILIIIVLSFIVFVKVNVYKKKPIVNFHESSFYKKTFNSDSFVLINVWSTSCAPCMAEVPAMQKIINNNKLQFVTISIDNDTLKLKKFLNKSKFFKAKDITLSNLQSRDSILSVAKLPGYEVNISGFYSSSTILPYTVLFKNKKIIYKCSNTKLDVDSINKIISNYKI